jgi:hypothetical protein
MYLKILIFEKPGGHGPNDSPLKPRLTGNVLGAKQFSLSLTVHSFNGRNVSLLGYEIFRHDIGHPFSVVFCRTRWKGSRRFGKS